MLVVACGNTLRGDDAVGAEVGELLAVSLAGSGVSVVVSNQLLPELADDVSRAGLVVFVDAAAGRPAGAVDVRAVAARLASDAAPARTLDPFSHGMGPEDVLSLARDLYVATPAAVLVSVGAGSFEPGAELTAEVRLAIPGAVEAVLRAISEGTGNVLPRDA